MSKRLQLSRDLQSKACALTMGGGGKPQAAADKGAARFVCEFRGLDVNID